MCGIVGGVTWKKEFPKSELMKARESIAHRGPDGKGVWSQDQIGLASRRLAIIDLKGGKQPMRSIDGAIHCVFNGEIYNFKTLRDQLKRRGYKFKTVSDTEVIVNGWLEWHEDLFKKLNGMFAIAVWDNKTQTLILALDHAGIKPLFYYQDNDKFIFGSEIKTIFAFKGVDKRLNEAAALEFLTLRYPLNLKTLYQNIDKFPPGHLAKIKDGKISFERYWQMPEINPDETWNKAVLKTGRLLKEAVLGQMVSDVPIGVFLSGGLDSSTIVALAAKEVKHLNTISVGFKNEGYSEFNYARLVANKYKTKHREITLDAIDYFQDLEKLISFKDEPLAVPNEIAIYKMAEVLKKDFTVVLSGEGADEVFAGYPKYFDTVKMAKIFSLTKFLPESLRGSIAKMVQMSKRQLADDLASLMKTNSSEARHFALWPLGLNKQALGMMKRRSLNEIQNKVELYLADYFKSVSGTWQDKYLHYDFNHHLFNLLERVDRMTMAASVEARVPFVDRKLVDYIASLPFSLKTNGGSKALIKEVMKNKLPAEIINRVKVGFEVPVLIMTKQQKQLTDRLLRPDSLMLNYCSKSALKEFVKNPDNEQLLWRMINLETWYKMMWS